MRELRFVCPACGSELEAAGTADSAAAEGVEELRCPADGHRYGRINGIWRFLPPDRAAYFSRFMEEYETVRKAEGRGSEDPSYYRALPFQDLTGRYSDNWRIRAASFRVFEERVLRPAEGRAGGPMDIVDLGAGCGWLSHRLALRGHNPVAVDLSTGVSDGLGAHVHFEVPFTCVQSEFAHLPFAGGQADLAVYNASFHYSTDYSASLAEALRVLRPVGSVVILDSPVYGDRRSGEQMVREREALFLKEYGFPSNAVPCENFLTHARLDELARDLGLSWEIFKPFYGLGWALRPWRARLRGRREPAAFMVIVGRRGGS
jgi:SAM-dependent methyltransferase